MLCERMDEGVSLPWTRKSWSSGNRSVWGSGDSTAKKRLESDGLV
jgi:hypothetical protein